MDGWMDGCRYESNCPPVEPGTIGGLPSVGGLSKGSLPVLTRVSEKTTDNSERLGRQARPEFECCISRLPVSSATTPPKALHRSWGLCSGRI